MKKYIFVFVSALASALAAPAGATSTTTITMPTNFVSQVLVVSTDTLTELGPYITLIVGVLLAVVVVEILIGIFRK